jgi:hypothetical protein
MLGNSIANGRESGKFTGEREPLSIGVTIRTRAGRSFVYHHRSLSHLHSAGVALVASNCFVCADERKPGVAVVVEPCGPPGGLHVAGVALGGGLDGGKLSAVRVIVAASAFSGCAKKVYSLDSGAWS